MKIIEVKDLNKTFVKNGKGKTKGSLVAVNNISFSVEEGEILAFIGPNGAGKSTTIKILTGILHPTSGFATVTGFTPWKDRMKLTHNIGCLFGQKSQLNQFLPVIDSYMLLGAIYDIPKDILNNRIDEYSTYFDIKQLIYSPAGSLSLGQRMICEIVGAILHNPRILFLDEPTIGLDIVMKQKVREMILQLNKTYGTTVILTSHDVGDVEYLCKRIIIINYGHIVLDDNITNLHSTLLNLKNINITFNKKIDQDIYKYLCNTKLIKTSENTCIIELDVNNISIPELIQNLANYGTIIDIDINSTSLEKIIYDNFKQMKG